MIHELGDAHYRCQVPPLDDLTNYTINEPLDWDPVVNFIKTPTQTDASYKEQLFEIKVCVESINSYLDFMNTGFMKSIIISWISWWWKKIVMMYIVIYARSKGLNVITFAMMCHQKIQLGVWHWHKSLCIPVDSGKKSLYTKLQNLPFRN